MNAFSFSFNVNQAQQTYSVFSASFNFGNFFGFLKMSSVGFRQECKTHHGGSLILFFHLQETWARFQNVGEIHFTWF
jgi:hypothetical protein